MFKLETAEIPVPNPLPFPGYTDLYVPAFPFAKRQGDRLLLYMQNIGLSGGVEWLPDSSGPPAPPGIQQREGADNSLSMARP